MLKNIPKILSPELVKILMEMGHGDTIVIADGNFPAASLARRLVRCDGHGAAELFEAILQLMPLDSYSDHQIELMQVVPGDPYQPEIWGQYKKIAVKYEPINHKIETVERFAFYENAKQAYAVVATSELALYANIMIRKGVINE